MTSILTYARTLRYLRADQIVGRVAFRLARPRPDERPAPLLRSATRHWSPGPGRAPRMTAPDRVRFLNVEADIAGSDAWETPEQTKLWLYNLHYFDDLVADGAADRVDWHQALVWRWIDENPPGWGTGWEPYPLSLRIVNWIKWHLSHGGLDASAIQSLAVQARFLMRRLEYHILGNHLLANAKALLFAGTVFDGDEAEGWRKLGVRLLERETREQVLVDGGHFELSPMYHSIVLEDLLDVVNLCRVYGLTPPSAVARVLPDMLTWSRVMRHPDGDVPFFNDAAFGVAPMPAALDRYADHLEIAPAPLAGRATSAVHLSASGYCRLEAGVAVVFADLAAVGPDYLPGHAHADTLSFELSLSGGRVIVNGGTSVYGTGPERVRQRSTRNHATVVVGGTDSSEVWGGFRVGRRARVYDAVVDVAGRARTASATHDGYRFLPGRPRLAREWRLDETALNVTDTVAGRGDHDLEINFPLHPDINARMADGATRLNLPDGTEARVTLPDGLTASVVETEWHPEFGRSVPNQTLRVTGRVSLPARVVTRFEWFSEGA